MIHHQRVRYIINVTEDRKKIFKELWSAEGTAAEKAKRLMEEIGEDAARIAQDELGIPFSLFQRAGVVGPEESLIIPGGEFYIPFEIKVEPGGELVVSPGTVMRFDSDAGITCYGLLRIIGSTDNRIRLLPHDETKGWAGVRLEGSETWGSILSLCEISGALGVVYPGEKTSFGGGLVVADTKIIKVHNCHFKKCRADYGGGMMVAGTIDLEIIGNTFLECSAKVGSGLAVAECVGVLIEANKIYNNRSEETGSTGAGAMLTDSQNILFTKNDIRGCSSGAGAGIMVVDSQKVFFDENLFFQNAASDETDGNGGGLAIASSKGVEITKCRFLGNSASSGAGMVIMRSSDVRIADCILVENSAAGTQESAGGGAFFGDVSEIRLERNRFENNMASVGAGFSAFGSPRIAIVGNVLSGNMARRGGGGAALYECTSAQVEDNDFLSNSAFQGAGMLMNSCPRSTIKRNRFRANQTGPKEESVGGAAIIMDSKRPVITENEFRENISVIAGALMLSACKNPVVRANHFSGNSGVAGIVAFSECEGGRMEKNRFRANEVMTEGLVLKSESDIAETDNTYQE
ncbi:MAG: right-handed parallel beta-helix repeat-containing protein [candidate division WOR-3 bacterium]